VSQDDAKGRIKGEQDLCSFLDEERSAPQTLLHRRSCSSVSGWFLKSCQISVGTFGELAYAMV